MKEKRERKVETDWDAKNTKNIKNNNGNRTKKKGNLKRKNPWKTSATSCNK